MWSNIVVLICMYLMKMLSIFTYPFGHLCIFFGEVSVLYFCPYFNCFCLFAWLVLSCCSQVWLLVDPMTIAHRAPLSMGFSRQEYWSGLPCLSPAWLGYLFNYRNSLYNLEINSLPDTEFAAIFSHSIGCPFTVYCLLCHLIDRG